MLYQALPRTLDAALRDLTDDKPLVRASAARDLVAHGETARARVVAALEKALADPTPLVRAVAAEGLGELAARDALPALLLAVDDADQLVRQKAIGALGEVRDPRAQKRLERALSDARPEVRYQAVIAYPRVTTSKAEAIRAIVEATRDDDEAVAHIAFRMAEELTEDAAGKVDDAVLARARACLDHPSRRVRTIAAVVLGAAGDEAADEMLISVVSGVTETPETDDVATAIDIVAERGMVAAKPALAARAGRGFLGFGKDKLWWHARTALAVLGDAGARSAILSDLASMSFERRTLAVSAAARAGLTEARGAILSMKGKPDRADQGAVETALDLLRER